LSDFTFGFDILVNMNETDLQLLTRYATQRAENAFAEVVRRNVDLVHSAALRQVRSPTMILSRFAEQRLQTRIIWRGDAQTGLRPTLL
jgi:predicted nucleotidyltransferase